MHSIPRSCTALAIALSALLPAYGQQSRIVKAVDASQRATLSGHIHPKATAANDSGRVAPSLQLGYLTLELTQTPAQRAELDKLLAGQQNPQSPDFHHWLTPAQYADRFGASQADIDKLTQWLRGQGLTVAGVSQGRNWIAFSGDAAHVEAAFAIEIHTFAVGEQTHFANATEPSVPAAFADVVGAIRGLHDFRMKPALVKPRYNSSSGAHYLSPNDFATIYDIMPAYNAGINGTGQTVIVAGQTQINLSDITAFQSKFNLPANPPQTLLVPGSANPGVQSSSGDLSESDLDLEWAGAVARNATILFVYSTDVMSSAQYAIDQNLGKIVTVSYGNCEPESLRSDAQNFETWAKQGNAQGITWFNAAGDNGGADCDDSQNPGLAVDLPASVPEITAVGGTEFTETSQSWNPTNDSFGASVRSYLPETSWNDSAQDGSPSASGGGASVFFAKPAWQVGPGVPGDNARDVPDIALNASADHDGYLVYTGGSLSAFGGTSAPTPSFAGIAALLNQYLVTNGKLPTAGLGNINPQLYSLAQSTPAIFHDVTTGNNVVTVASTGCGRRQVCPTPTPVGYNAGVGYDQVTGLGSVDVWNLMTGWSGGGIVSNPTPPSTPATATITLISNLTNVGPQDEAFFTATATALDGVTTPVGNVAFTAGATSLGAISLVGSAGISTATLIVPGFQLPTGTATITATYNGSASSTPVTSSVNVNVRAVGSSGNGIPAITGLTDGAAFQQRYSPGMIMSVFGATLAPPGTAMAASSVPLPVTMAGVSATVNGVIAPLYYVSPTQLNIQLPWQTPVNSPATITVNNNGQIVNSQLFEVGAVSPGIFTDSTKTIVPFPSAAHGQVTTLFIAGAGAVTPVIATGSAPAATTPLASLPAPANTVVTVAGVQASTSCQYCFVGIPAGLVGVTQINFQIPSGIPVGQQQVIVSVNGVASPAAYVNVTN